MAKKNEIVTGIPARRETSATRELPARKQRAKSADGEQPLSLRRPVVVVGIGASAGGLDAFKQFFTAMGDDSGIAFVLIQHLDPTHHSLTAELLRNHTRMGVVQVTDEMPVEPNHVYVIPPNNYLTISGQTLHLTEQVARRGVRVPIDFFFRSLADDQQQRAIGVILSGTGSDGTLGVREIKAAGGMVMVQAPETAQYDGMPRSAIAAGVVDYVLPVEKMADVLLRYVQHRCVAGESPLDSLPVPERPADSAPHAERSTHMATDDLTTIVGLLRLQVKYDFSCYKKGTLTRRVERRMGLKQIEEMGEYVELLRQDKEEVTALFKDLLIGVTNFFREPAAWVELEKKVIEPLVATTRHDAIRAWVAGCATGEEPFSLAMLLTEKLQQADKRCGINIFASDIDQDALAFARAAIYPENIAADVTPERLRRFFSKGEHTYRLNEEIREAVIFAAHNVISDPPFSKLDLVSCRNLLIYLEPESQQQILARFHFALRDGGYLFLGNAETITQRHELFEPVSRKWRIYRRIAAPRGEIRMPGKSSGPAQAVPEHPALTIERRTHRLPAAAQQLVLQRFAPACALVNRNLEVQYLHGPIDDYLQLPSGEQTHDLIGMARQGLRTKLRAALRQAILEGKPVTLDEVRVRRGGTYFPVRVTIEPLRQPVELAGLLLVTFDEGSAEQRVRLVYVELPELVLSDAPESVGEYQAVVRQLERELTETREDLQTSIEEFETSNEEFKAAHEEVTSINEELHSTNEELESSKEELQSLNEELRTVNSQLETKVGELESTNNDLCNLLASIDQPTLFLDRQFRIRRFTPATTQLLRLIATDVGRPLADITWNFQDDALLPDCQRVLRELRPLEAEISCPSPGERREGGNAGKPDGDPNRWYLRRITPYRTEDDRIQGVVLTFNDITFRKHAEQRVTDWNETLERRVAEQTSELAQGEQLLRLVLDTVPHYVFAKNRDGRFLFVNRFTAERNGFASPEEMVGALGRDTGSDQSDAEPRMHDDQQVIDSGQPLFIPAESVTDCTGQARIVQTTKIPFTYPATGEAAVLVVSVDITQQMQAQTALHDSEQKLRLFIEHAPAALAMFDKEMHCLAASRRWLVDCHLDLEQVIGKSYRDIFPDIADRWYEIHRRALSGEALAAGEGSFERADGTIQWLRWDVLPWPSSGTELGGVVIFTEDITRRKDAEQTRLRLEQQIAERSVAERQQLGRELHDGVGQQVTVIGMIAAALKDELAAAPSGTPDELLDKLDENVAAAKQQIRSLISGLSPVDVEGRGLSSALERLTLDTAATWGVACRLECQDDVPSTSSFVATQLFLIAAEAARNAAKHAAASEIVIRLSDHDGIRLVVSDNGVGLPPADERNASGMGLRIMRYRAGLIGAELLLESPPQGGTIVSCFLKPGQQEENRKPHDE